MKGNINVEERQAMPSEKEIFRICGPLHLSCVDWRIPDHRRSVAASLVQGVYILDRDRQQNRTGPKALAPFWWEFFDFQRIQILVDQADSSIFGAIYEYKHHKPKYFHPMESQSVPPKFVIAFRGTITKPVIRKQDLFLDIQLPLNRLNRSPRYQTAFQAVENIVIRAGHHSNVWLTGHSLGAAIALQAGKDMAKKRFCIESYLFNPPYISAPIEQIDNPCLKKVARITKTGVKAGLSLALNGTKNEYNAHMQQHDHDPFMKLKSWIPHLFVNPKDLICAEYITYFEHRENMEGYGIGDVERIANKNSIVGLIQVALGRDGEASHLIPSASVTKNVVEKEQDLKRAHGIQQWWEPHTCWHSKVYRYR